MTSPFVMNVLSIHLDVYFLAWVLTFCCGTHARDVQPQAERYLPDYRFYHNLSSIETNLADFVHRYPHFMKINWLHKSKQKRPQMMLHVTNFTTVETSPDSGTEPSVVKVRILLSYGEHAREFLPIESLFYLLTNLTNGLSAPRGDPAQIFSTAVLSKIDLFIVVLLNPDGRNYVEKYQNYCWRGTSNGVDLNRNFDWNFGQRGSSGNENDEEYRGTHPFSEPEGNILLDLTSKIEFDAFVSLHSGTRQIYIPYADTKSRSKGRKPNNYHNMLEVADRMSRSSPHSFPYGQAYKLNEYTADGTIFDYMAGIKQIPFSFAIELWGEGDTKESKCFDIFNPESHSLQSALHDIHPIYEALFTYLIDWKYMQMQNLGEPIQEAPSLALGYVLLIIVIVLSAMAAIRYRLPVCAKLWQRRRIVSLRSLSSSFSMMV